MSAVPPTLVDLEIPVAEATPADTWKPGRAEISFELVRGRTEVTRARATSPLRLLSPRQTGSHAGWTFLSAFGGGLLAGDALEIDLRVAAGATAYVSSQSSTKVYRCPGKTSGASQALCATVAEGALLALTPDPVVCFADSRYAQSQRFDVALSAGLVMLDWFTAGRHACGERWELMSLHARNELHLGGKRVLTDVMRLEQADGAIVAGLGMGVFHCLGTLVMVGERVRKHAERVLEEVGRMPVRRGETVPMVASRLADGVILRFAATGAEPAARALLGPLEFLADMLGGGHPWQRKW